ncbi:MAG: arsenate reductase ArsC [Acidimicrobiales bacterium]|nr:arsenate reductase ArsC [Acidimicrobiales bacterium]
MKNPGVLFLCVHNAGRSQMGAGWMRHFGGDRVRVFSAGSAPASQLNASAVAAMAEVGIDITAAQPQRWTESLLQEVEVVISMGCGDACPVYPGKRYVDWPLDDPAGQDLDMVRQVREQIKMNVLSLLDELMVEAV